jgi:large subunit ribosomal protein L24
MGSLRGNGKVAITDARFAGLDPRAFDAVTRAVDQGLAIDPERITNVVRTGLEGGQLSVKSASGAFTINAGQLRLSNVAVDSKDAALTISCRVDFTDGSLDARLVLSGSSEAAGARPDIYMALKGPVGSPSRSIDVSALSGWLTLRGIENQTKRLRAIEAAQPKPAATPPAAIEVPVTAPENEKAPALPAPIDIVPLPSPNSAASRAGNRTGPPTGSVGPQN